MKNVILSVLVATAFVLTIAAACDDSKDGSNNANNDNVPVCGNGIVEEGEECDDGTANSDEPDACRPDCKLPSCGDGVVDVQHGEECDAGVANSDAPNAPCRPDCTLPRCGDGILDDQAGEECDQGQNNSDSEPNACRTDCKLAYCGDGVVDDGEECDDGTANSDEPDACRTDCTLPRCGDGVVDRQYGESCDTGDPNDPSCPNCMLPSCGDGILDDGEECDDGVNNSDTEPDRCRTNCMLPWCGDGVKDSSEQCDGTDLGGATCESLGFSGGTLACTTGCKYDTTGCTN